MGAELYFLKLDKEKVADKLVTTLLSKQEHSYQQHLSENYSKTAPDEFINFDSIIATIEKNVELLSVKELWSMIFWFHKKMNDHTILNYLVVV